MIKPDMRLTLQQVRPPLPDPYEFSEAILESLKFIDEHPDATIREITNEMLELWSVPEEEVDKVNDYPKNFEALFINPAAVSSYVIFAYVYVKYYRMEDFASLENFIYMYGKFQIALNRIQSIHNRSAMDGNVNIFFLDNLDTILDSLTITV